MNRRPKHPKPDGNNRIVVDALESFGPVECDSTRFRYTLRLAHETVVALKIADMPGQTDWILMSSSGWYAAVEVKDVGKETELTDGEKSWRNTLGLRVSTTKEDVIELIEWRRLKP